MDAYFALLSSHPNLSWIPLSLEVADIAAKLRALHALRTPDAIQAATAIYAQATGLLTNDSVLQRVAGYESLVLDDVL